MKKVVIALLCAAVYGNVVASDDRNYNQPENHVGYDVNQRIEK